MRSFFIPGAVALLVVGMAGCHGPGGSEVRIDPQRISEHVRELSSDAFAGRGPATAAEPKVIDYVVRQLRAMGLQPGGENGGWTQAVPLARFQVLAPVKLGLKLNGQSLGLVQGDQVVVQTLLPVD